MSQIAYYDGLTSTFAFPMWNFARFAGEPGPMKHRTAWDIPPSYATSSFNSSIMRFRMSARYGKP